MQPLKSIFINGTTILALLFGLTLSAAAIPSFEDIKVKAEKGNSTYQVSLGNLYRNGEGVRQDLSKAFYWYQKSADQGDSSGQLGVGFAYLNGQAVRQDSSKALEWFKKAAYQDDSNAQSIIGAMYEYGDGVPQNKTTAKELYGKSCDNGNQVGCDYYKKLNEQGY